MLETLQSIIQKANRIVFFGGAGVSTESGIPDFRGSNGIYGETGAYPPETILSRSFFDAHPDLFFDFYRKKILHLSAKPNGAHLALAKLEQQGKLSAVVTQNIDGLHQRAGSRHVLELHGSVHRNYCMRCHRAYPAAFVAQSQGVPRCACGGIVKPDVVLYEESLNQQIMLESAKEISKADVLIVGGTSLTVYPAAGFLDYFSGNHLVLINQKSTPMDGRASLIFRDSIASVLQTAIEPGLPK